MSVSTTIITAIIISFAVSVILCPIIIPLLKKMKFGQYIREEGPKSHQSKAGTPTMGGMIILAIAQPDFSVLTETKIKADQKCYKGDDFKDRS